MSLKTPVFGTDRSRVSVPSVFICLRRLNMYGCKIIISYFAFLKSSSVNSPGVT